MIGGLARSWSAGRSRRPPAVLGLASLAILLVLVGPLFWPVDPVQQDLLATLQPPSLDYPLGSDHLGRDILARLLHGAPRSLGYALVSVAGAASIGLVLGLIAADRRGWTDALIMRLADLMLAFPGLLLALLLAGFLGGGPVPILIALVLTHWPQFARMARAVALGELTSDHVEASQLAGLPRHLILARQILPPVLRQTTPLAAVSVGGAIMTISALGFLGLGMQPPTPEWGAMITELLPYVHSAPVQIAAPCLAIFVTVLSFLLLGDRYGRPR